MAAIKELKSCPKCRSMRIATIRTRDLYGNVSKFEVHCWNCNHSGPEADTGAVARDKWNEEVRE